MPTTPSGTTKAVTAVATGECYAGLSTATSGTAVNAGLLALVDDQGVFPAFVVAPVVREGGRADAAAVMAALDGVAVRLDTDGLAQLNARVTGGEDARAVAEEFLAGG